MWEAIHTDQWRFCWKNHCVPSLYFALPRVFLHCLLSHTCLKFMCPHINNRNFVFLSCTKFWNRSLQKNIHLARYDGTQDKRLPRVRRSQLGLPSETISKKEKKNPICYSSSIPTHYWHTLFFSMTFVCVCVCLFSLTKANQGGQHCETPCQPHAQLVLYFKVT